MNNKQVIVQKKKISKKAKKLSSVDPASIKAAARKTNETIVEKSQKNTVSDTEVFTEWE